MAERDLHREGVGLTGRAAYEADLIRQPLYHDGTRRKTWDRLGEVERWSWCRPARRALRLDDGRRG